MVSDKPSVREVEELDDAQMDFLNRGATLHVMRGGGAWLTIKPNEREDSMLEKHLGDVGPGWAAILQSLDYCFQAAFGSVEALEKQLEIRQVKEKFGGLRVYIDTSAIDRLALDIVFSRLRCYLTMAEAMSFRTCEECGATQGVSTRGVRNSTKPGYEHRSWQKTYCQYHHAQRDARQGKKKGL
jgi:hypothetical protein